MKNTRRYKTSFGVASLMVGALAFAVTCQPAAADSVHLVCLDGAVACGSGGTPATITDSTNPAHFGLTYSGTGTLPISGSLVLDFLVPVADGSSQTISVTGSASGTATLVSSTPWTSGNLSNYLGDVPSASPTNPIGAYTTGNPAAGGYYVYEIDFGTETLCQTATPCFTLTSNTLPNDTYILSFLGLPVQHGHNPPTTNWVATANSEAILDGPAMTPEPSSLALLGSGVLGLAGLVRRKFRS